MRAVMTRTRTWLLLSGALGVHLFGPGSQAPDSWWTNVGWLASTGMLLASARHPRLAEEWPADQQVVVHDVDQVGRGRVLALLGHGDPVGWRDLIADGTAEPWTVVTRLTVRRAGQVVAHLREFGVRAERTDDPRVRLHLGILRAIPVILGIALLVVSGSGGPADALPAGLQAVAVVGTWLAAVAISYVVVDLAFAGQSPRPSDWAPDFDVTGPYDVELLSLEDDQRMEALRVLRVVRDVDADEARELLLGDLPAVVHSGLSRVEADRLAVALEAAGGTVAVVRRDEHEPEIP